MIEPTSFCQTVCSGISAYVDPRNPQLFASSVVTLHQHSDGVAPSIGVQHARTRPDPALELVANHAGAAAHIALLHWTGMSRVESMPRVFRLHVKSVDVVEVSVPRLGDDRQRPPVALHIRRSSLYLPGDDRVAHDSDAMSIRDHHWTIQKSRVVHPCRPGHFTIAVECEPGGKYRVVTVLSARMDRRDAGAHRSFSYLELALPGDQGRVPNF